MKNYILSIFIFLFADTICAQEKIKIGALLHLTGVYAQEGKAFLEGMELKLEEINSQGGVNGIPLELEIEDTACEAKHSLSAIRKLLSENKEIKAVAVSSILEIKNTSQVFESNKIPALVLWDSTPEIDDMGEYVFAIGPWAPDTGEKSSRFAYNTLKKKRAVIICNQHDWGLAVSEYFKKDFVKRGGEVLQHEILNPDTTDFKATILKIKSLNPDVIYAPLNFGMSVFARQLKQMKIEVPVMMSDNVTQAEIDSAHGGMEGIYHSSVKDPENQEVTKLKESYLRKYKKDPKLILFNAWGYDAVGLFAEAIKNGKENSISVQEALYKIKNYKGATGEISINSKGSSPMMISMFQVRNSKFELVEEAD